jgi:uncharacterized protein YndB with AHSA1/START domain
MTARSTYVYVSYIRTTPEKLWQALTDPEFTRQYWFGMRAESEWKPGSPWKLVASSDGAVWDAGEILEAVAPRRLVIRWVHQMTPELKAEGDSICTMEIEPGNGQVKLTITHTVEREGSRLVEAVSGGWPQVISNLKSLLEIGQSAVGERFSACGS